MEAVAYHYDGKIIICPNHLRADGIPIIGDPVYISNQNFSGCGEYIRKALVISRHPYIGPTDWKMINDKLKKNIGFKSMKEFQKNASMVSIYQDADNEDIKFEPTKNIDGKGFEWGHYSIIICKSKAQEYELESALETCFDNNSNK